MNYDPQYILELIVKGIQEDTPYAHIPVDAAHLLEVVSTFETANSKFFFLRDRQKNIVGLLAGVITEQHPLWYGVKIASELFWYVHPDHRGSKKAVKLIMEYEAWAKERGCKYTTMAHFSNLLGKKLSKLYKKLEYAPIEVSYIKELK